MEIKSNKVVSINYTLTSAEGKVLDTSDGRAPLLYIHGKGNIIPGLEKALEGKKEGDKLNVTVAPEEAYGIRDERLVQIIPRSSFEGVEEIEPGMQFQANFEGHPQIIVITKVEGDNITIDANHPLAGEQLTFDVAITEIRDATEEELAHGHVHGPNGHHH